MGSEFSQRDTSALRASHQPPVHLRGALMAYQLDTNVLLRIAQPEHALNQEAAKAVRTLLRRQETLHLVPQTVYEFWVVATCPVANNGLGFSVTDTQRLVNRA